MSLSPKSTGINLKVHRPSTLKRTLSPKSYLEINFKAHRPSTLKRTTSYTQRDLSHFAYEPWIKILGVLVVRNFNHDSN